MKRAFPLRTVLHDLLILVVVTGVFTYGEGADSAPALAVRESGAVLFARQDNESEKIAILERGESLIPIGHAVGAVSWYFVRTQSGLTGWVQASDVIPSDTLREALREPRLSTWSARTSGGRNFEGTWTANAPSSPTQMSGTWALRDATGIISLRGVWSAQKSASGWTGVWSASMDGQKSFYAGTWTADFTLPVNKPFNELFEAAAREAVRGIWNVGDRSGSWVIRAGK